LLYLLGLRSQSLLEQVLIKKGGEGKKKGDKTHIDVCRTSPGRGTKGEQEFSTTVRCGKEGEEGGKGENPRESFYSLHLTWQEGIKRSTFTLSGLWRREKRVTAFPRKSPPTVGENKEGALYPR